MGGQEIERSARDARPSVHHRIIISSYLRSSSLSLPLSSTSLPASLPTCLRLLTQQQQQQDLRNWLTRASGCVLASLGVCVCVCVLRTPPLIHSLAYVD